MKNTNLKWKRMEETYGLRAVAENTGKIYEIMKLEHALLDVQHKYGWFGSMLTVNGEKVGIYSTQKECKIEAVNH